MQCSNKYVTVGSHSNAKLSEVVSFVFSSNSLLFHCYEMSNAYLLLNLVDEMNKSKSKSNSEINNLFISKFCLTEKRVVRLHSHGICWTSNF